MKSTRDTLMYWGIPFVPRGGVTLVSREHASGFAARIIEGGLYLRGYEGFTLFPDGRVQPHMEWSASWSKVTVPSLSEIQTQLKESPPEVTHFEFVFQAEL